MGTESSPEKKSQENQGWMVSPFSPAKKCVGCCGQHLPPLRHRGRRQRCGSGERWGLSAPAGAQGKGNKGAEVQLRAEQFTHVRCAAMNGDMRYSQ